MKVQIAILLVALCLTSCAENKQTKDYIVFSGKIENVPSKKLMLGGDEGTITIELNEDGTFSDTLTQGEGHYVLFDSRNRLDFYFTNGSEYNLTADLKHFKKSAKLTGSDTDGSKYLMTKIERIKRVRGNNTAFYSLDEKDFLTKEAELSESYTSYLDSFPNLPKAFEKSERE